MAHTEFYVTGGYGASDYNGGGPRLGTDDGPVYYTYDATVTSGEPTVIIDNSLDTWSGVAVDDFVQWDVLGVREIRRVVATSYGGDKSKIAVSAACTPGVGKRTAVGGAWATPAFALSKLEPTMRNAAGDNVRLNIKADAVYTGDATTAASASYDKPVVVEGYTVTPGDGGEAELRLTLTVSAWHEFYEFRNLFFNRAAASGSNHAVRNLGSKCLFVACRAAASAGNWCFYDYSSAFHNVYYLCRAIAGQLGFYVTSGNGCRLLYCSAETALTGPGFTATTPAVYVGCVAEGVGGAGFVTSTFSLLERCIAYKCGGSGFEFSASGSAEPVYDNCIAFGNGGYGWRNVSAAGFAHIRNCAAGANTSGAFANIPEQCRVGTITLPTDPFVDGDNRDFALDVNSPSAWRLIEAGAPELLLGSRPLGHVGPFSPRTKRGIRRRF